MNTMVYWASQMFYRYWYMTQFITYYSRSISGYCHREFENDKMENRTFM